MASQNPTPLLGGEHLGLPAVPDGSVLDKALTVAINDRIGEHVENGAEDLARRYYGDQTVDDWFRAEGWNPDAARDEQPPTTEPTKAQRLLADGAVRPSVHAARLFEVRGDDGDCLVTVAGPIGMCTCPERGCPHIEAARKLAFADSIELAGYVEAIEARKDRDAQNAEAIFAHLDRCNGIGEAA